MRKKRILLGTGGHAKVLTDILISQNKKIDITVSHEKCISWPPLLNTQHLSSDEDVLLISPNDCVLVNGIGFTPNSTLRQDVFNYFSQRGYHFETLIADSAVVSPFVKLDEGVQIIHGAIIQPGCDIGANTIVNTGAKIDHDCKIGNHSHIAPSAILCGNVSCGEHVFIGAQSCIIPGVSVVSYCIIGAGTLLTHNVTKEACVTGSRPPQTHMIQR